jgi:phosphatidylglycerophosphate synthase
MSKRLALRIVAAILGIALLTYLILRAGPATLMESLHRLGWGLALIIAMGGLSHLVKTYAWRLTLVGSGNTASIGRMFELRLISEAAGQVGAVGQFFGEGLRVSALSAEIPIDNRVSSVTLDRALFVVSGAIVTLVGLVAALFVVSLTPATRVYAELFAVTLIILIGTAAVAMVKRWPFLSAPAQALRRVHYIGRHIEPILPLIHSVENRLFDFHRRTPFAFWASLVLNLVGHGLAVLEVYVILLLLGVKIGLLEALVFEALTKLVNIAGSFNPGNLGTYEGGNILIARMFALPASTGLAIAVARRTRAIFWTAIGILCFILLFRPRARSRSGSILESQDSETPHEHAGRSIAACVYILGSQSSLLRVGTLPILLRTILSIRKITAQRIIVCAVPATKHTVERELLDMGRLPHFVDWLEASSDMPLPQILRQIASESRANQLLVVDGNNTFCPALFHKASEWNEENGALSLTTAGKPIGIDVLSASFALEAADLCPSDTHTLEALQAWLVSTSQVQLEEVEPETWQRVVTAEDRLVAERKLDRWLVKPTDGIFARMNRQISIPISRQIIRLPITPNMVSIFTLGVGLASGIFFARGGYWNILTGAVLSVWASILDGCDGEVARLKLMETDFGCWLETVCDWLYYLFIFGGIAVGLTKTLEPVTVVAWGSWLLLGAVMSFLVTGFGRQRLANRRPEQYLAIWQAKAESRPSNPILYIGRNTEFIVRRCFLPYALLFFAVLDMMKIAFFLSAIGANLVWLIALYSYSSFAVRRSKLKDVAGATD